MFKCILSANAFNTVSRILQSVPMLNLRGNTDAIIGIVNLNLAVLTLELYHHGISLAMFFHIDHQFLEDMFNFMLYLRIGPAPEHRTVAEDQDLDMVRPKGFQQIVDFNVKWNL